jgi:hypothetical protein
LDVQGLGFRVLACRRRCSKSHLFRAETLGEHITKLALHHFEGRESGRAHNQTNTATTFEAGFVVTFKADVRGCTLHQDGTHLLGGARRKTAIGRNHTTDSIRILRNCGSNSFDVGAQLISLKHVLNHHGGEPRGANRLETRLLVDPAINDSASRGGIGFRVEVHPPEVVGYF